MKGTTAALFFGILIVSIGLAWVLTGGPEGTADALPSTQPAGIQGVSPIITVNQPGFTAVPDATLPAQLPATTDSPAKTPTIVIPVTTQPERQLSADQVRDHFLDIAYSSANRLERLNYSESHPRVTVSLVSGAETDRVIIADTAKEFNAISKNVKISEMPKEGTSGDVLIKFLPAAGLDTIIVNDIAATGPFNESLTAGELSYKGAVAARIMRGTIYINADLDGNAQNHTLARSLMYEMGVTGESTTYPDSLFYSGENTNTKLSPADKKAIALLYEPGLTNGMNLGDLRHLMYIP